MLLLCCCRLIYLISHLLNSIWYLLLLLFLFFSFSSWFHIRYGEKKANIFRLFFWFISVFSCRLFISGFVSHSNKSSSYICCQFSFIHLFRNIFQSPKTYDSNFFIVICISKEYLYKKKKHRTQLIDTLRILKQGWIFVSTKKSTILHLNCYLENKIQNPMKNHFKL